MRIEVTAQDIASGQKDHCWSCPVARATRRAYGSDTTVDFNGITIWDKGRFSIPKPVLQWIISFDKGLPVEPFSFELPDEPDFPVGGYRFG